VVCCEEGKGNGVKEENEARLPFLHTTQHNTLPELRFQVNEGRKRAKWTTMRASFTVHYHCCSLCSSCCLSFSQLHLCFSSLHLPVTLITMKRKGMEWKRELKWMEARREQKHQQHMSEWWTKEESEEGTPLNFLVSFYFIRYIFYCCV